MSGPQEVQSLELAEGRIAYRALGDSGEPVVLLHGGGLDNGGWTWKWLAPELAANHRVFVPDQPKHGGSWPWRGRADQRGQEHTVERLLDHWGLESVTLIGLSLGSATSLGFALRRPECVNRLVLTSRGGIQDRVAAHELSYLSLRTPISWLVTRMFTPDGLERWIRSKVAFSDEVSAEEAAELASMAAEEYRTKRRWNGHMFCDWNRFEIGFRWMRTGFMGRMGELSCPVLFVHGGEDTAVPVRFPREAAERAPAGRPELIERAATADTVFFDTVSQVRMDAWSQGRVVLVGDAAWSVSLLAGYGSSLAVGGGELLGTMLDRHGDVATALGEWERRLRPIVLGKQRLGRRSRELFIPSNRLSLAARSMGVRLTGGKWANALLSRAFGLDPR